MADDLENPVYFVGGVNGVGKSSVLSGVEHSGDNLQVVKGSAELMKWLNITPGDYASLQTMPDEVKNSETNRMFTHLIQDRDRNTGGLVLDTHYLLTKEGKVSDIGSNWLHMVSAFVLVTARAEEVYERLRADELKSGQDRRKLFEPGISEDERLAQLNEYLARTRQQAEMYAARNNRPLLVLDNNQGNLSKAVNSFLSFHRGMMAAIKNGLI